MKKELSKNEDFLLVPCSGSCDRLYALPFDGFKDRRVMVDAAEQQGFGLIYTEEVDRVRTFLVMCPECQESMGNEEEANEAEEQVEDTADEDPVVETSEPIEAQE
jgi:hypothetical protein